MSKILIPLDGSEVAEAAIRFAARQPGDELLLLRVVDPVGRASVHPMLASDILSDDEENAREYLELCPRRFEKPVETLLCMGHPVDEIVAAASRQHVDRIVMSTRGRTGFSRWLLGSVAENVCRRAPCPVWLIPRQPEGSTAPGQMQKILIATDGSKLSEAAIDYAARLQKNGTDPRQFVLMQATNVMPGGTDAKILRARADMVAALQDGLETLAAPLHKAGGQVSCRVEEGYAAASILETAEREKVDAIFLCTHGKTGWRRFILGSVAEMVARYSTCPVVLINTRAAVEEHPA